MNNNNKLVINNLVLILKKSSSAVLKIDLVARFLIHKETIHRGRTKYILVYI